MFFKGTSINIDSKTKKEKVILQSLNPGETFLIGAHEFIVLKQGYDFTKVISKNLMARDVQFDENTGDYNKSALKQYVDKKIRPIILKNVGEENLIKESVPLTSLDNQTEFINCICDVRPLTFDEVREYNNLLVNNDLLDCYWTITPWSIAERGCEYCHCLIVVAPSGYIFGRSCNDNRGVRPLCTLKSNIFVQSGEK